MPLGDEADPRIERTRREAAIGQLQESVVRAQRHRAAVRRTAATPGRILRGHGHLRLDLRVLRKCSCPVERQGRAVEVLLPFAQVRLFERGRDLAIGEKESGRVDENAAAFLRDDGHRREDRSGKRLLDHPRLLRVEGAADVPGLLLAEEDSRAHAFESADPERAQLPAIQRDFDESRTAGQPQAIKKIPQRGRDSRQSPAGRPNRRNESLLLLEVTDPF
jgi:hypothetical protein